MTVAINYRSVQSNVPVGHIMIWLYSWHSNENKLLFEIKIGSNHHVNPLKILILLVYDKCSRISYHIVNHWSINYNKLYINAHWLDISNLSVPMLPYSRLTWIQTLVFWNPSTITALYDTEGFKGGIQRTHYDLLLRDTERLFV